MTFRERLIDMMGDKGVVTTSNTPIEAAILMVTHINNKEELADKILDLIISELPDKDDYKHLDGNAEQIRLFNLGWGSYEQALLIKLRGKNWEIKSKFKVKESK